ncbi:hypothetical protein [Sporosarcina sp. FSL K6-1508]|uniref:hypothetical protein n=1 Tax=Sporosarcina sp. FSL K6-1508 TaxID=2921553 RepID=UPI0030F858E1
MEEFENRKDLSWMQELFVKRTLIGFILKVSGLVVISWGIIYAFILQVSFSQPGLDGMSMIESVGGIGSIGFMTVLATYAIYGILLIGFGEVIDLLQKIHDRNEPYPQALQAVENNSDAAYVPIPLFAEQEIKAFYSEQNIWIDLISPTRNRNVFIVKGNGRTEYIELGEATPKVLTEEEIGNLFN